MHQSGFDRPHVVDIVNEAISKLAPFSALILTVILIVFFLVRYYIFELYLMRSYGEKYTNLNEVRARCSYPGLSLRVL